MGVFVGDGVKVGEIGVAVGRGVFIAAGGCVISARIVSAGILPWLFVSVDAVVGIQPANIKMPIMSRRYFDICLSRNRFIHGMIMASGVY
jgi:hypothetical protein